MVRWQQDAPDVLTLALISRGTPAANRAKFADVGVTTLLLQQDREAAEAYQASGTPAAVLVRPDGTIGSPLTLGVDAIRHLVARLRGLPVPGQPPTTLPLPMLPSNGHPGNGVAQEPARPVSLKVGDPAPALMLPDLVGTPVHLADFQGHSTLVLFWNPDCGFCQRMLDDLKAWEAHPPKHAPQLLIVSTGTVADNQALGLRSPAVLDQGFTVGRAFGATGTPMGVLVDAEGRIASELAAGAPAVLALATQSPLAAEVTTDLAVAALPTLTHEKPPDILGDLRRGHPPRHGCQAW